METDHLILRENVLRNVTVPEQEANLKYLEGLADAQAAAAGASATAASTAKTAAEAARDAASASQTAAAQSKSDSAASATQAVTARQTAEAARDTATQKAASATADAATATAQAGTATTQAGIATTKAGEASDSAATATTQAGIATTQASAASSSASAASVSATTATQQAGIGAAANSIYATSGAGVNTGLTGLAAGSLVGGSGGANGTFPLTLPAPAGGGTQAVGTFTVAGGAVTAINITTAGARYLSNVALTNSAFAASGGLSGASATLSAGGGVDFGKYFYVPSTNAQGSYDIWLSNAGVAQSTGNTLPNLAAVQANTAALASAQATLDQVARLPPDGIGYPVIMDADGRMLIYVDLLTGKTKIPDISDAIDLNAANITANGSLIAFLQSALSPIMPLDPATGIAPIVLDAVGRIMLGSDPKTGLPFIPGVTDVLATQQYDSILPNDSRLLASDYVGITEKSAYRIRFLRTVDDNQGYKYCSPGSRVAFMTNAALLKIRLTYSNLITRVDVRNSLGYILADGAMVASFSNPNGDAAGASIEVPVNLGSSAPRKIEILWPYLETVDLTEILVSSGAGVSAPDPRPAGRLLMQGDSITHGARASGVMASWTYQLALTKGMQMVNMGYGGRRAASTDGIAGGQTAPTKAIYMIGTNDYLGQVDLTTFKNNIKFYVANFRAQAGMASTPLYLASPIYCAATASGEVNTMQAYRDQISAAVSELSADANLHYINGLSLMTNSTSRLNGDLIHPNDTGAAEIATNFAAQIA